MIRLINIAKTDQLVVDLVKEILELAKEEQARLNPRFQSSLPEFDNQSLVPSEGFSWLSPEQFDSLPNDQKREVLKRILSNITVQFDRKSSKHHLSIECCEPFSVIAAGGRFSGEGSSVFSGAEGRMIATSREIDCTDEGSAPMGKALNGSQVRLAAASVYSVTVE